ncbi:unnamed protein product, partial [marine sediment metagenome]
LKAFVFALNVDIKSHTRLESLVITRNVLSVEQK